MQHHFISLDFLSAIHARDIKWGRTQGFLPGQLYIATNPFTIPLWLAGLGMCLFVPSFRCYRAIGIAFLVTFGIMWASCGRSYYLGPTYSMLLAAGSAGLERWLRWKGKRTRRIITTLNGILLFCGTVAAVVLVKPVAPINSALWNITSKVNGEVVEMVGWDDLASQVSKIYAGIPAGEKTQTVILAGNYGEACAFDLYRPVYGLPSVISGANSLWERGYGNSEPQTVIVVGFDFQYALNFFKMCESAGKVTNRYNVRNEESTLHTGIYVCHEPRQP